MLSKKSLPLSAKIYIKLRPLIIPFGFIEKHVPQKGTIVDIGCGFGIFANYLALKSKKRKVIGIDIVEKRISWANKTYDNVSNLSFMCGDITGTKIPSTDIITAVDVFHHIPTSEFQTKLLKSCFGVLSKNGKLIIKDLDTKPLWKYWWNWIHDYLMTGGEQVLYQDQNAFKNLLEKTGFHLEKKMNIKNYPYAHVLFIAKKV